MRKGLIATLIAVPISLLSSTAIAANCYVFKASVIGEVKGPYGTTQSNVAETMVVRDAGIRNNRVEFAIFPSELGTGDFALPDAQGNATPFVPRPGHLRLASNSGFPGVDGSEPSATDLGSFSIVGILNRKVRFKLDPSVAFQKPFNLFLVQGPQGQDGMAGQVLEIVAVEGQLEFSGSLDSKTAQVSIDISGSNMNLTGAYKAKLDGTFVRNVAC